MNPSDAQRDLGLERWGCTTTHPWRQSKGTQTMTPQQIEHVQTSFRLVLPIQAEAAELFYGRLFEIDPGVQPLFAHTDLKDQGNKLMSALGFVVGALHKPDTMLDTVAALARRHVGYGVVPLHYASVGQALVWTIRQGLGDAATPEVIAAWTAAYRLLSETMLAAADEHPQRQLV
jgi:hemoglobin-like flavoprotein